jgi:hypothetical protein
MSIREAPWARRWWLLALAAVFALMLAGAAGAVVRYTIITIKDGNYAHLSGTKTYCQNGVSTAHLRTFFCGKWSFAGSAHRQSGTFGALLNQTGIRVYRITSNDRSTDYRQYLHGR